MADPKIVNPINPNFKGYLDPDFIEYYNKNLAVRPATHHVDVAQVRANPEKWRESWCRDYSDQPNVKTFEIASEDGTLFRARSYHPDAEEYGHGPYPVHINYHGRSRCWVSGDLKYLLL